MTSLTPQRIDEVTAWIDQDPDETTRAELSAQLCAAKDGDPDAIDRIEAQFSGHSPLARLGCVLPWGRGPPG